MRQIMQCALMGLLFASSAFAWGKGSVRAELSSSPGVNGQPSLSRPSSQGTPSLSAGTPPLLEVSGFSWAENLEFDGQGNLYVSDTEDGTISRIWWSGSAWLQEIWFNEAQSVNGLAVVGDVLYANIKSLDARFMVVRLPLGVVAPTPEVISILPDSGNGLEPGSDGMLYVTTEGNFLPGDGKVFQVDPVARTWKTFVSGLWAADGIAIDRVRELMYVTQVMNNKVIVISLPGGAVLKTLSVAPPRARSLLDDIVLTGDGNTLYGADFGQGNVLKIPLNGDPASVVYSGLQAPTSVLFGRGPDFNQTSLYVTEGGGLLDSDHEQRVLEIPVSP